MIIRRIARVEAPNLDAWATMRTTPAMSIVLGHRLHGKLELKVVVLAARVARTKSTPLDGSAASLQFFPNISALL